MTFEVEIDGKTRTIAIESLGAADAEGGRFRVRVDGVVHEVEVRRTDLGLSLLYTDDHRTVDMAITERPAGEWLVDLPHVALSAIVDGRRFRRGAAIQASTAGPARVNAPMPGRVMRVLVKPGDEVAARQGLVVIEAMKMENELSAPKAGRIKEVAVAEGQSVESGRLLVVIE